MKTLNIFGGAYTFTNEELEKAYNLAKENGLKVWAYKPSGKYIKSFLVDNGVTFGSVEASYSGVRYGTRHKSENGSGQGTGYGLTGEYMECLSADIEMIMQTLEFAPKWVLIKDRSRIKKESFEQYRKRETILKYEEI